MLESKSISECGDCKMKDKKINGLEARAIDLTDYIKNSNERVNSEKRKFEEQIKQLTSSNLALSEEQRLHKVEQAKN